MFVNPASLHTSLVIKSRAEFNGAQILQQSILKYVNRLVWHLWQNLRAIESRGAVLLRFMQPFYIR